jgi:hypothetical protein
VRCACVAVDQGGSEAAEAATSNDATRITVSTKNAGERVELASQESGTRCERCDAEHSNAKQITTRFTSVM